MGNQHSSGGRAGRTYEFASPTEVHHNHQHHPHHHLNPSDCFGKREEEEDDEECYYSCGQTVGSPCKSISRSKSSPHTTRLRILPKRRRRRTTTTAQTDLSFYLDEQEESEGRGAGKITTAGPPTSSFYPGGKTKKTKKLSPGTSSPATSPQESHPANHPPIKSPTMTTETCKIVKFAKLLQQQTKITSPTKNDHHHHHGISREAFQRHVMRHSPICAAYLWDYYNGWSDQSESLKTSHFVQRTEKLFGAITDKDQANFYVKLYSKDKDSIDRSSLLDLLVTSYQLSPSAFGDGNRHDLLSSSMDFEGKEWMESVSKSCFHMKETMSVFYVVNWLSTNMPHIFVHIHKYIVHQLTTGYTRLSSEKDTHDGEARGSTGGQNDGTNWSPDQEQVTGMPSALMWLLSVSIPEVFMASLEKKEDSGGAGGIKQLLRMQSRDLLALAHLMSSSQPKWTQLYDSVENGLSINRFQYHVFNYRGPTLLFLKCDNDYEILVGIDCEWKENCHFWGGKSCFISQLKPEFRLVEMGEKSLYANFSIRGYPIGVHVGKDPRNVSLNINPDFEHVDFKKIPSRIASLTVWGCGSQDTKTAQVEHKNWEAKECEKKKKININAGDWKDNPDKYLLELGGNYKSYGG